MKDQREYYYHLPAPGERERDMNNATTLCKVYSKYKMIGFIDTYNFGLSPAECSIPPFSLFRILFQPSQHFFL